MPEVTVLMPVKNGQEYIKEAIDSVLKQTFSDFEFIIMDDGSEDETVKIIESYTDPRIRLEKRKSNFIKNLNEGLLLAKGDYVARMDADDIMHTERLRIQLKRMKQNQDIDLCTSWVQFFQTDGNKMQPFQHGEYYVEQPILKFFRFNFIAHPAVMLRKTFLDRYKLTYQNYSCAEDYKLWFEIAKCGGKIFIEPQYLMFLRSSELQTTVIRRDEMLKQTIVIKKEILNYLLQKTSKNKVLYRLLVDCEELIKEGTMSWEWVFQLFHDIIYKKMNNGAE